MNRSPFHWCARGVLAASLAFAGLAWANGQCPAIGQSASCSVVITINPDGKLTFSTDPTVPPYDGDDDTLVGVQNRSGATVFGIQLTGNGIFAFDGDGAAGGNYAGPDTSFSIQDSNTGTVNFDKGLDNNAFLWFSLEGPPSGLKLSRTVTIDPGHGYNCARIGQPVGAVGVTDYPISNPPAGFLHEDDITVAIAKQAQGQLAAGGYNVVMTKTDALSCPSFAERGERANNRKSNLFVSIHANAPSAIPFFGLGTSALYNATKLDARTLADMEASQVSASLGVNNRGSEARDELAVLKATVSRMTSVIVETARLSGSDEDVLHDLSSAAKAAAGIKAGLDAFINQ